MTANELLVKIFREGGVSPIRASKKIGRNRTYVSNVLSKETNPGVDNLATILDAADYDLLARHRSSGKEYVITPRE
jgi:DNA-binding phage protein